MILPIIPIEVYQENLSCSFLRKENTCTIGITGSLEIFVAYTPRYYEKPNTRISRFSTSYNLQKTHKDIKFKY